MADIGFFSCKIVTSTFLDGKNGFNDGRRPLFGRRAPLWWCLCFILCLEQRDTYLKMTNVL